MCTVLAVMNFKDQKSSLPANWRTRQWLKQPLSSSITRQSHTSCTSYLILKFFVNITDNLTDAIELNYLKLHCPLLIIPMMNWVIIIREIFEVPQLLVPPKLNQPP